MPNIIDLCSSPDPQPSRPSAPAKPASAKPLTSKVPTQRNDDPFELSSDDDDISILGPSLNRSNPFPTTKPNISKISSEKTTSNAPGVVFFEDDFDSTVNLDESILPPNKRARFSPPSKAASKTIDLPPAKKSRLSPPPKATGYKRSISNIETSSKATASRTHSAPILKKAKTSLEDDIMFTSSPDVLAEAAKRRNQKRKEEKKFDDFEDVFDLDSPKAGENRPFTDINESSEDELPDISNITAASAKAKPPVARSPKGKSSDAVLAKYNKERAAEKKAGEKAQATKAKERAKKDKGAQKEIDKERKVQEREDKKLEKERAQELAKVNVSRTDKKISTSEMIVDFSSGLDSILADQVRKFLGDVSHSTWENTAPIVKWRRKINSKYNDEKGHWEPTEPHVKPEKHILYMMTAEEFVERATGDEGADLDIHFLHLKAKFDTGKIIYLMEGLNSLIKKNRNLKNRQFAASVNAQLPGEVPAASQRRKKDPQYVAEDILEDALLRLQVIHGATIHHTNSKVESAEWIFAFTQHISTIPYKAQKDLLDTAFCMESGQVKSGDDAEDTYGKMLQEINRITASVAYGIIAEYPTAQGLVKGLKENGPLVIEDCRKMANKNGAFTDKRVGPAISKRVHSVFTGRDPTTFDV